MMKQVILGFLAVVLIWNMGLSTSAEDGYIELVAVKPMIKNDTAHVQLTVAVHFPDYTIPGYGDQQNHFRYQILLQLEDEAGNLVYSRTVTRSINHFPVGQSDTLTVNFRVPKGIYRLFLTPLNVPVYIQDLSGVPLPLLQRQVLGGD